MDTWDKVFPKSDLVSHEKVSFTNQFGIKLVADVYQPASISGAMPAIAVSGPFGAVKEQSSGLYAQRLAEQGFITVAFDPSFTGESGGEVRNVASPDINTEDFLAAVDYLTAREDVTSVGILGICGWGGIALNAAALDPRIKATVASTMYDMTRVSGNGYFDQQDSATDRNTNRRALASARSTEYSKEPTRAGGVIDPLPSDAPQFVRDYHAYYKTPRGFHPRSGNSTEGWNTTGTMSYLNARFMYYIGEIDAPVLIVHGSAAHSLYFGEAAYEQLAQGGNPGNKELLIVEGASHCDLYDTEAIPFERLSRFYREALA